MFSPRLLRSLSLLAVLGMAGPAAAYVRETTSDGRHNLQWPASSFPVTWQLQSTPPGSATNRQVVIDQFQKWQAVSCAEFQLEAAPGALSAAQAVAAQDGSSRIFWQSNWTDGSAVLGLTTPWYDPSTGVISEADMQFNNQDWTWYAPGDYENCEQSQTNGCADTASIALHEEGHFLGLAHSLDPAAVMFASWDGTPKRDLTNDDIQGICSIYPRTAPGAGLQDQACSSTADCATGLTCEAAGGTSAKVCSKGCAGPSDTSCTPGDSCQQSTTGNYGCFPAPTGGTQDQACDMTHPCADGYWCITDQTGSNGACKEDCDPSNPRCVNNLKCNTWASVGITTPPTTSQGGFCDGMGPPPGADECAECDDANPCKQGLSCVPLNDQSGKSVCRSICNSDNDCSLSDRCLPTSSYMTRRGICGCEAYFGNPGEPCKNDGTCNAGVACVNDGSSTGSVCRTECGGSLPACHSGYYCKQFDGVSACVVGTAPAMPDAGMPASQGGGGDSPAGGGCQSAGPVFSLMSLLGLLGLVRRRLGRV